MAHKQSRSFQSSRKNVQLKHSNQTTFVDDTRPQTKIDDHIGALHQGRAHVTMSNAGTARRCVRSTVTIYGR